MNAEFRIVHYLTDPFLGGRLPVAALVREGDSVRLVRAQHLPGTECLGGPKHLATLRMILDNLAVALDFDRLPQSAGPFAVMTERLPIPDEITDPDKWVRRHILPTTLPDVSHTREPNRSTFGYELFRRKHVDRYVKKRFNPRAHWSALFGEERFAISTEMSTDPISHWVEGAEDVLLMEPLVPNRSSFSLALHSIARNFSAYRYHLDKSATAKRISLVAYILRSSSRERREQAILSLQDTAHRVIDLSNPAEEKRFISDIRTVGESGMPSSLLS